MSPALSHLTFAIALVLYAGASGLYFFDVARHRKDPLAARTEDADRPRGFGLAPLLLGLGAVGHATYVTLASFIAHVCPVHSVHFFLSIAALVAIGLYLALRKRFRIQALGLLVSPLGLTFLLGTFVLGKPEPEPHLSPIFIALHVLANLLGIALFLLAGGAATLYLVQERRLKQKRPARGANLPALDVLDHAVHRFLVAGFPLLTLGIVSGTFWARQLETGTPDEVMRIVLGYATWFLIAGVLLLRAAAGWRGRRAAYGTIAGFLCAMAVVVIYLVRPAASPGPPKQSTREAAPHGEPFADAPDPIAPGGGA